MKTAQIIASALVCSVNAWWDSGHLLTARHAHDILAAQHPAVLDKALVMLRPLKRLKPEITTSEGDHPFVECATFADEIKGEGYSWQKGWHFIDQPITEPGETADDFPDFHQDTEDNVGALGNLTNWLMGVGDYMDSPYYQQIVAAFDTEIVQKSFALRLIIHYAGDIHQPLHTVSKVNSTYPSGDYGGNLEHLPEVDGVTVLHAVWDSVSYSYTGYANLPMSESEWEWYGNETANMSVNFPANPLEMKSMEFQQWADEGLAMAESDTYPDFGINEPVSAMYQQRAEQDCRTRIIQGGERLADTMFQIFGAMVEPQGFLE